MTVDLSCGLMSQALMPAGVSCRQMTEGQPGREMYMLTSGELEVLEGVVEGERRGHDAAKRLGFLSDGAFCERPIAT